MIEVITTKKGIPATVTGNGKKVILHLPPLKDIVKQDLISETKLAVAAGWPFSRMEHEINNVIARFG